MLLNGMLYKYLYNTIIILLNGMLYKYLYNTIIILLVPTCAYVGGISQTATDIIIGAIIAPTCAYVFDEF